MSRKENREGSARQLSDGSWECITQSKYLNPKTGSPKRFKRKGKTEKEAIHSPKWLETHGKKNLKTVEIQK